MDVRWPVEMPRSAVDGRARFESQRRPRHLAIAGEAQPSALDARPAQLALVTVDRRARARRPAQHQQLDVPVLEHEMSRVPSGLDAHEGLEGGGLDPRLAEPAVERLRIEVDRAAGADRE